MNDLILVQLSLIPFCFHRAKMSVKIVVIGNSSVGKTSLVTRYVSVGITTIFSLIHLRIQPLHALNSCIQGRSQDFVIGGAKRKFGGASLKNF